MVRFSLILYWIVDWVGIWLNNLSTSLLSSNTRPTAEKKHVSRLPDYHPTRFPTYLMLCTVFFTRIYLIVNARVEQNGPASCMALTLHLLSKISFSLTQALQHLFNQARGCPFNPDFNFFKASAGLILPYENGLTGFHSHANENQMKRWAPGLALKKWPKGIRKWPIAKLKDTFNLSTS